MITTSGALRLQTEHDVRQEKFLKSCCQVDKFMSELERKIIIFVMQCGLKLSSTAKLLGCGRTANSVRSIATALRADIKKEHKFVLPVRGDDLAYLPEILNAARCLAT